ncbi:histone-fold-containing protein [Flagelloscypha sp. PMI_526]|nr:histone-fold-containing protein [Flagelloscypha sp. PMI_526]
MPRKDDKLPISAQAQQDLVSDGIENFELPKALVTRIAKSAIPENSKLQKETVLSLVKGSTVFINYLAATAHDVATSKNHKSITAADVLRALELLELGDLVDPFTEELNAYRDLAKTDKTKKGNAATVPILPRSGPRNGPLGPSSGRTPTSQPINQPPPQPTQAIFMHVSPESASRKGKGKDVVGEPPESATPSETMDVDTLEDGDTEM